MDDPAAATISTIVSMLALFSVEGAGQNSHGAQLGGRPTEYYLKSSAFIGSGSHSLRPSNMTGCFSSTLILCKSAALRPRLRFRSLSCGRRRASRAARALPTASGSSARSFAPIHCTHLGTDSGRHCALDDRDLIAGGALCDILRGAEHSREVGLFVGAHRGADRYERLPSIARRPRRHQPRTAAVLLSYSAGPFLRDPVRRSESCLH